MIGCPIRYPPVTAYLFFILVSFWYRLFQDRPKQYAWKQEKALEPYSPKAFPCVPSGGDKRDRTADLLNAIQALSQLSYNPIK